MSAHWQCGLTLKKGVGPARCCCSYPALKARKRGDGARFIPKGRELPGGLPYSLAATDAYAAILKVYEEMRYISNAQKRRLFPLRVRNSPSSIWNHGLAAHYFNDRAMKHY